MPGIQVDTIEYGTWGKCVRATNGIVEVIATLELGPRIIRFGFVGGPNMFREDTERKLGQGGEPFRAFGGGEWKIYGGHRLWTSPEALPRTYYPDNEPVDWRKTDRGFALKPPAEKWTQLQKEIEVALDPAAAKAFVTHRVTNLGPWPTELAVWALSVMDKGGTAYLSLAKRDTGLLPNTVLSLWPYSKMNDPRVTWGNRLITLRQDDGETPFKLGYTNEEGWAAYALKGDVFVKRYRHVVDGRYPDYGVSFESYVCGEFLELETLGELKSLAPGQTAVHDEVWEMHRGANLASEREDELYASLAALSADGSGR